MRARNRWARSRDFSWREPTLDRAAPSPRRRRMLEAKPSGVLSFVMPAKYLRISVSSILLAVFALLAAATGPIGAATASWQSVTLGGGKLIAIAVAPSAPRIVYSLSGEGYFYASTDGAARWSPPPLRGRTRGAGGPGGGIGGVEPSRSSRRGRKRLGVSDRPNDTARFWGTRGRGTL